MKGWYPAMKKILALMAATLLVLFVICSAMADGVTFTTEYFTLELPEDWIIYTDGLEVDKEEGYEELGFFYPPDEKGIIVGAAKVYYEELNDLSLWNASEEKFEEYKEMILDEYADEKPEYIETFMVDRLPFILFRCTDEDGTYLYADTIANGHSFQFTVYEADEDSIYPVTDEDIALFKTILATFKPVTAN